MFDLIVRAAIRERLLTLVLAALVCAYGVYSSTGIDVDVLPDLTRPSVTILAESHGMAPEEVELQVAVPLESAVIGIAGVERVRSAAGIGLAMVTVEFDYRIDPLVARQLVAERLTSIGPLLPPGVVAQIGPMSSVMGEILLAAIPIGTASAMTVRDAVQAQVRPRLLAIPGVSQVTVLGGDVRRIQVEPDLTALAAAGITLDELLAALRGYASNASAGFVEVEQRELLLRIVQHSLDLAPLRHLTVATAKGLPVALEQVAQVRIVAAPKRGDAGLNGDPAVILSVQKQPGINTLRLTQQVEQALQELKGSLPAGVGAIQLQFRQADFIQTSIATLRGVLIEASIVVAIVLWLFMGQWRATAIALVALPVSLLLTAIVFQLLGLSINTMTLGGLAIAIGELVDDAVVGVENTQRRLRANAARALPLAHWTEVAAGTLEVRAGIWIATLILLTVMLPLFFLDGVEGRLFESLGGAYLIAIASSLLVAISITPVLSGYLLTTRPEAAGESPLTRHCKRLYGSLLDLALGRPRLLIGAAALLAIAALISAAGLPRAYLPPFNESTLLVSLSLKPGLGLTASARLGAEAERLIVVIGGVASVGRRTGRAEQDSHVEPITTSEIDVRLDGTRPAKAVVADIRAALAGLPGGIAIGAPIAHRIDHLLSGVQAPVVVKLYGDDFDANLAAAAQLRQRLATVPGLVDVRTERIERVPQFEIRLDHERLAAYGLSPGQLTQSLAMLGDGERVSQIIDGVQRIDVQVRLADAERAPLRWAQLLVPTATVEVPLAQVARLEEILVPGQIVREGGKRRTLVYANLAPGANLAAVDREVRQALLALPPRPAGIAELAGQYQAQSDALWRLAGFAALAALGLTALLYSHFRSWRLSLMVLAPIPLALIGAVAGLWWSAVPLSVASAIGFVTLTGIAARNSILKISHSLDLAGQSLTLSPGQWADVIRQASLDRLPPVLMTALSAGLALLPLLYAADQPGKEILHPVALCIFGGLISATLLDALVTPALLLLHGPPAHAQVASPASG